MTCVPARYRVLCANCGLDEEVTVPYPGGSDAFVMHLLLNAAHRLHVDQGRACQDEPGLHLRVTIIERSHIDIGR